MEEHPSKRRKVALGEDQSTHQYDLNADLEPADSFGDSNEKLATPKLVLPAHHAFGVHGAARREVKHLHELKDSGSAWPAKIQIRQLVNSIVQPVAGSASTVLAVAIDNGSGVVSEMDVPMASKSVWIPGYGELTMTNLLSMPTITATSALSPSTVRSNPGAVTPPPAVQASQARNQALQTQEAIAKQYNVVPQAPPTTAPTPSAAASAPSNTVAAPSSAIPAQHTPASQSPLAINTPESRSQQILSSPPTPNPATPQSSAGASASYFSSSPASLPNSSPAPTSSPPTTSQFLNPNTSQLSASANSTTSATTLSRSSTAVSLSLGTSSSETSRISSSASAQITTSQVFSSSSVSLSASASLTSSSSGFATSTRSNESLNSRSSTSTIPTATTLKSSTIDSASGSASQSASASTSISVSTTASSQVSSQSASVSSLLDASSSGPIIGGIGGPSNTATAPSSPTSSSGGSSGGNSTPPAPVLAGGIIGGVAGAAILVLLLVLFLRWRRGKTGQRRTISPPISQPIGAGGAPQTGNMTQRSSTTPIAGAAFLNRFRPVSSQTATTADTAPSERGFQKISGRKLPSVLTSGGDGYGENPAAGPSSASAAAGGVAAGAAGGLSAGPAGHRDTEVAPGQDPLASLPPPLRASSPPRSLSGSSFYRDSRGFYGGVVPENGEADNDTASTPSTSPSYPMPLNVVGRSTQDRGSPLSRQPEVAITRPGPARTPVINQPGTIPVRNPSRANQPPPQNPFRDGLGRSHPSQDGSRGSRFREDTTPP